MGHDLLFKGMALDCSNASSSSSGSCWATCSAAAATVPPAPAACLDACVTVTSPPAHLDILSFPALPD